MAVKKDNNYEKDKTQTGTKSVGLDVPFIDLSDKDIPVRVLKEIPEEAAVFYRFVPIEKSGNVLKVGMIRCNGRHALGN